MKSFIDLFCDADVIAVKILFSCIDGLWNLSDLGLLLVLLYIHRGNPLPPLTVALVSGTPILSTCSSLKPSLHLIDSICTLTFLWSYREQMEPTLRQLEHHRKQEPPAGLRASMCPELVKDFLGSTSVSRLEAHTETLTLPSFCWYCVPKYFPSKVLGYWFT